MFSSLLSKQISNELVIYRRNEGVQLAAPDWVNKKQSLHETGHSVSSILAMPFNVAFHDLESKITLANEQVVNACHFASVKKIIGKSVYDFDQFQNANKIRSNDITIINKLQTQALDEEAKVHGKLPDRYLSIKSPILNDDNQVIGIFVCSMSIGQQAIAEPLMHIAKMGLFTPDIHNKKNLPQSMQLNNAYLTPHEASIMKYVVRGKTAKQIALIFHLSHRTIEHHLENIKHKVCANSRSELIDMAIDKFI